MASDRRRTPDSSTGPIPPRWVSVEGPTGELTLALAHDGTFTLSMVHWEEESAADAFTEELTGRWTAQGVSLTLMAPGATLHYVRDTVVLTFTLPRHRIRSLRWTGSSTSTFADGLPLGEQEEFNSAFRDAYLESGGV